MVFHDIGNQLIGFPRTRAVAYADQIDAVFLYQFCQRGDGFIPLFARRMRVNSLGRQQFPRRIDYRRLDAGAYAGIQAHRRLGACRSGQQQVL